MAYVKLFGSILASTIWREDATTRLVWITMLAMADRDGIVSASVPGLAHMAQVDVENCRKSLQRLMLPDPDSRTRDYDGRRVAECDGGWVVLNYEVYRDRASLEDKREKDAARQRRRYQRKTSRQPHATSRTPHAPSRNLAYSEEDSSHLISSESEKTESRGPATVRPSGMAKRPDEVAPELWRAFLANRTAKRKPLTVPAWTLIANRIAAAGVTVTEALTAAVENGWADWKPEWADNRGGSAAVKKHISRDIAMPGFSKDEPTLDWEL